MTANKRTVAGAAAAIVVVAAAGLLATGRQHGGPAVTPAAAPADTAPAAASDASRPSTAHAPADKARQARKGDGKSGKGTDKGGDKPLWRSLTPAQQQALQPLRGEWDDMDGLRKQKWLQLANRYAAMPPEEQQRVQQRMREWVSLTPAQRELARETYNRARRIAPADKNATWESYQQLPEDQKRKLAASSARKAPPVVPSQAGGKGAVPLGQGAASCPAGMVRNSVSATPPCVAAPAPSPSAPSTQPATPANPAPPAQQEKPVPANWGITPNDA